MRRRRARSFRVTRMPTINATTTTPIHRTAAVTTITSTPDTTSSLPGRGPAQVTAKPHLGHRSG